MRGAAPKSDKQITREVSLYMNNVTFFVITVTTILLCHQSLSQHKPKCWFPIAQSTKPYKMQAAVSGAAGHRYHHLTMIFIQVRTPTAAINNL
jgi:hypothetical protein